MFVKIVILHKHFKMLHFWAEEKEYGDVDVLKYTRIRTTFNRKVIKMNDQQN